MRTYLKIAAIFCVSAIALSSCGVRDSSPSREEMAETQNVEKTEITLYVGTEAGDGLVAEKTFVEELTPEAILSALAEKNVISKEVELLAFQKEEGHLILDLSKEYQEYAASYGTSGEMIIVGGVVNTFLDAYAADTITILVEGESWDTGHAEYSGPLGRY